jgi:hypothetical protein
LAGKPGLPNQNQRIQKVIHALKLTPEAELLILNIVHRDVEHGERLRLNPEAYRQLCREVLQRDSWRCQSCGGMRDLQVHHIQPRGRLGDDSADNLIALCGKCHQDAHRKGHVSRNLGSPFVTELKMFLK